MPYGSQILKICATILLTQKLAYDIIYTLSVFVSAKRQYRLLYMTTRYVYRTAVFCI